MRKTLIAAALSAAVVGGLISALGAGVADAADATSLPITSFYQIVPDTAQGYLFISQGSSSENEILVTNLAGQEVTTIAGQDGVMGMALSADGSTLYAALASDHAVSAISTTTLKQTASYSLGDANTPQDVAVQSGKVWVSYTTTAPPPDGAIGDIDLSAAEPAFETQAAMGDWYSAPNIAADPGDSGVLVAAVPGLSPTSVASYDTSVDPVTVRASSDFFENCSNEDQIAVVPGGSEFILACGAPYAFWRYSTADLSQQGSYAGTYYPDAVAIDANGDVAGGTEGDSSAPDLYVYQQGGDTPLNTYNLVTDGGNLASGGLAFAPDGSQLYAVLSSDSTTYSLQVIDGPTLQPTTLSLAGPASVDVTQNVVLTGSLVLGSGTALPAGTPITIRRTLAGSTATASFTVTTAADGSFTLTDTPPEWGSYTYTASYAGATYTAPATASASVTVDPLTTSLSVTASPAAGSYEPTVQVTAHLGATYTNRVVSIYAQPFGSSSSTLLETAEVNSSGNLAVSYRAPHSTMFSVVFSGDAYYGQATASTSVVVLARVSESLSGYFGSKRIGKTTYRLYRVGHTGHVHVTVAPNKSGECVKFQIQIYYKGSWQGTTTACGTLDSSSKLSVAFKFSRSDAGYHYRMRADYIRGTDDSNLDNDSPWEYLIAEK